MTSPSVIRHNPSQVSAAYGRFHKRQIIDLMRTERTPSMNPRANGIASPLPIRAVTRLLVAVVLLVTFALQAAPASASTGSIEFLDAESTEWATNANGTSLHTVARAIDADDYWYAGYDGSGVDVAIIDSGVLPVPALSLAGKVVNGPDLSFESQADNLRYLDTFGHGTHLAGIIAGRAPGDLDDLMEGDGFLGIAPGARLVSLKVADSQGAADITQVLAAIDWVVEHRTSNGLNIRVLNLAFGTDGYQPHEIDPLHAAVERAWRAGIVVVVSAGNDGNAANLRNPATDPFVIAVGASDTKGTADVANDEVTDFSNCGTKARYVDVVAPGKSLISLRAPGSLADTDHPEARVGAELFKGSGTSQAAAVVSGAAALVIDQRPDITPDGVKQLLKTTAQQIDGTALCQGRGSIDLGAALDASSPTAVTISPTLSSSTILTRQAAAYSDGSGSIDAARGTHRVVDEGVAISGEIDIMGNPFNGAVHAKHAANGMAWDGGDWNGASWSGASWSGASWSGASWSGASWSGASWSGASWSSKSWSGASWSGASWSGASWSGASWSGASWSGNIWLGLSWD